MKLPAPHLPGRWRHGVILGVLVVVCGVVVFRLISLMVLQRDFLLGQGQARSQRVLTIPAYRGMIMDRNGEPLAVSSPVAAIWANPQEVTATQQQLQHLAQLLQLNAADMMQKLHQSTQKSFIYLIRGLNPAIAEQVKKLDIPGIYQLREYKRYYPEGEVSAHVVGFTNIDDRGQEGLELAYNDWLQGVAGKRKVVKDRLGRVVEDLNLIKPPKPGHDLTLSLDGRIQYLAYRELADAIKKYQAKSGSVVVLKVDTGEVLAMANLPSYNPNRRPADTDGRYRNRAVTDIFEPGSTIKAFSIANALSGGAVTPDTVIDTSPGWIRLGANEVNDPHDNGPIDVTTILQRSSNVGVTKLTLAMPPASLYEFLSKMGFGRRTDSGFPGESAGRLTARKDWQPFTLATLAFGYGMSVTLLQLAHAYGIVANDGIMVPISLLKRGAPASAERVMSAQVAQQIRIMLESVVEPGGTATRAQVPGYRVAGKTGTVRIVGPNGYERNHHIGFFVGLAPASHPKLVVATELYDPRKVSYYGGIIAAPLFSKVMGGALRILDISPDSWTRRESLPQGAAQ